LLTKSKNGSPKPLSFQRKLESRKFLNKKHIPNKMEISENRFTGLFKRAIISLSIIIFFISLNFKDTPPPFGWYQQFLPNLNGRSITDICFLDSLTGYVITNSNGQYDTAFVLKTTNGGDNWFVNYSRTAWYTGFNKIKFLNINTGFFCGVSISGGPKGLTKTTNGGFNWFDLNTPDPYLVYADMSVLNADTICLVASDSYSGGVFRTTNGGLNWTQQFSAGSQNPNEIYMFNSRIGFIGGNPSPRIIWKTTNGGNNWFTIDSNDYFAKMYFIDSLVGWKCSVFGMKKTTNGGLNWITQQIPSGGNIIITGVKSFSNINRDTIWGVGGSVIQPGNQIRGILYRTTNGGNNWYYQIPDTSIHIGQYSFVNFLSKLNGWGNSIVGEIHTITSGDTTFFYTGVIQTSSKVPNQFVLKQNYPNPFNPRTVIGYELKKAGDIKIKVYSITGSEVFTLVNQRQTAGVYEVDMPGIGLSSGVYFYRLVVDGVVIGSKIMVLIK
jgi:photosystem II stability/assembly factor-like uncharacterized protein